MVNKKQVPICTIYFYQDLKGKSDYDIEVRAWGAGDSGVVWQYTDQDGFVRQYTGSEYGQINAVAEGKTPLFLLTDKDIKKIVAHFFNTVCTSDVLHVVTSLHGDSPPAQPVLISPFNDALDVELTTELNVSAFFDPDTGDVHAKTDWQISTGPDFSFIVLSQESTMHLTSLPVPDMILEEGTIYYWRARFYDNNSNVSEWSNAFSFTTLQTFTDTNGNGIPDDLENFTADLDNDGTPDIQQTDTIKTLNTVVGSGQMGVSIRDAENVTELKTVNSIDPDSISRYARPDAMSLGMISYRIRVANPGDTAHVTVYFSEAAPADASWFFYDAVNGWTDHSKYVTFSQDRMSAVVELKDGGYGDSDGVANGIIVDPSGFGIGSWLKGKITDAASSQGIGNAVISFPGINLNLNTLTDGQYLTLLLPGTYDMTATASGYESVSLNHIRISEADIVIRDMALSPVSSETGLTKTQVSQLYVAIFNRASEGGGNTYWRTQPDMATAATAMLNTGAAKDYFGSSLDTHQAFIEHIYLNTLNKTIADDAAGIAYWVGLLDAGTSRGEAVASLVGAIKDYAPGGQYYDAGNAATVAAYNQFTNRVTVSDYMADRVMNTPDNWQTVTSFSYNLIVTNDGATVAAAKAKVDQF